ncbi:MAG: hypothetical protein FWF68_08115 [Spirochaetes bacterium]|nr:hypothetical protein [Spirochaetota bacterium]
MKWFTIFLGLLVIMNPYAQENTFLDYDIDSLFDSPEQDIEEKSEDETSEISTISLVKKRGIIFDASFEFIAGIMPGWKEAPWFEDEGRDNFFFNNKILKMSSSFVIDAQISEAFRVLTNIKFSIPPFFNLELGDFFFDYNIYNKIFFRAGKYEHTWGISPNFGFTNLLSRVPAKYQEDGDGYSGEAFTFKIDIPIKIGGIQLLTMTRDPVLQGHIPSIHRLGYGAKYNIALPNIDLDIGFFYQKDMPFRSFLSLKKTIGKTEVYNEWLGVIDDIKNPKKLSGSANIGFYRDFLDNKLSINGEVYYNAEIGASWYSPKTNIMEEDILTYLEGFNAALNLIYRFKGIGPPRFFAQTLYSMTEKSALFIPGFRLTPFQNMEFYFAVPMALGRSSGYYYQKSSELKDRPFSVVLLLTLKGGLRTGYSY